MYQGRMTIRNALNKSLNVPAVKAFNAVGDKKVAEFAQGLGMPVEDTLMNQQRLVELKQDSLLLIWQVLTQRLVMVEHIMNLSPLKNRLIRRNNHLCRSKI